MPKKMLRIVGSLLAILVAVGAVSYVRNGAPTVRPISAAEAANPSKPFVVKLHAQWCPVCMLTKPVWRDIEREYSSRVNLVVFDFTDQAATDASEAEAERLGLGPFFEENAGWTGAIAIVDPRTKETTATIQGSRDFADYRAAIDASLRANLLSTP
jgi:thiol-disulfide isomerase/thioredoxin